MTRSRVVALVLAFVAALVLLIGGGALAQPQGGPPSQGPHQSPPGGGMGMRGGGMQGGMGMMGGQSGMCAHLIGAPMPAEPKAMGRMLQLCGEMFRSMGEIMMKHGKQMESGG